MRDAAEFDAFYAGTSGRVLGQVWTITGSMPEAEDAVAEAYGRAWQHWQRVRACDSPEAWVRRAASRIAISAWRKAVNRVRAHQRAASGMELDGLSPDHIALMHALRAIPADQRLVIVLHHLVGLSIAEIAAEVQSPEGTVKARLHRARRALAEQLQDGVDGGGRRRTMTKGTVGNHG